MKSLKLLFIALVSFLILSLSTDASAQKLGIGFQGGVNFATISVSPANVNYSSKLGFAFGGLVEIQAYDFFHIQPEIMYIQKGGEEPSTGGTTTLNYNYIEIPIYAKFKFNLSGAGGISPFKPYIFAGPKIGFLVAATSKFSTATTSTDISADYESIDFGLEFGAGGELKIAPKIYLFFGGSYSFGLPDIYKPVTFTVKNNGFRINAGMKFGL